MGHFDFWWWLASDVIVLVLIALIFDDSMSGRLAGDIRNTPVKKVFFGIFSAAALYLFFLIGKHISQRLMHSYFPWISALIFRVYLIKEQVSPVRIFLLLFFVIAPGEEIFWRGFLQHTLAERHNLTKGILISTLFYTAVHIGSLNPILIITAFIVGFFWGLLYAFRRSILLNAVSHALWDIAIFVFFPLVS